MGRTGVRDVKNVGWRKPYFIQLLSVFLLFFYLPLCLSRRLDLAGLDSVRSPLRSIGDRGGEGCWENIGTEAPTDISVLLRNLPLGNGHRQKKRLGKELGIEMNRH